MAAEMRQQIAGAVDAVIERKAVKTAARALGLFAVAGNDDAGFAEAFHNAGSNDADDAAVPALSREHKHTVKAHFGMVGKLLLCLAEDVLFQALTRGVAVADLLRVLHCGIFVFRN